MGVCREKEVYMGIKKRQDEGGRKDGVLMSANRGNSHRGQVIVIIP